VFTKVGEEFGDGDIGFLDHVEPHAGADADVFAHVRGRFGEFGSHQPISHRPNDKECHKPGGHLGFLCVEEHPVVVGIDGVGRVEPALRAVGHRPIHVDALEVIFFLVEIADLPLVAVAGSVTDVPGAPAFAEVTGSVV